MDELPAEEWPPKGELLNTISKYRSLIERRMNVVVQKIEATERELRELEKL